MALRVSRRTAAVAATVFVLVAASYLTLTATVTTRRGVNSQLSIQEFPAYVKAIDFLHRHFQYELLASEIVGSRATDRERLIAVFDWTRHNVPATPPGRSIVDDHILHIIIRGHGVADQQADVFATLATYAGVPAFWTAVPGQGRPHVLLSFARVDGRWRVFDVANGLIFRTRAGDLATFEDLARDPGLIPPSVGGLLIGTIPYSEIVTRAKMPAVPPTLRAELQMPWPRASYELRRALGVDEDGDSQE